MEQDKEYILRGVIRELREENRVLLEQNHKLQVKLNEIYLLSYAIKDNPNIREQILTHTMPI